MDITVMDNPIDKLPPEGGYYAALLLAAAGIFKAALPWLRSRDAAHAKLTKEERDAQRAEERDLVLTLKARVEELTSEVKDLRHRLDEGAKDKIELAKRDERIKHLEADNVRLREDREHFAQIGKAAAEALASFRPEAAKQILEEISEADEATSQAGVKK